MFVSFSYSTISSGHGILPVELSSIDLAFTWNANGFCTPGVDCGTWMCSTSDDNALRPWIISVYTTPQRTEHSYSPRVIQRPAL